MASVDCLLVLLNGKVGWVTELNLDCCKLLVLPLKSFLLVKDLYFGHLMEPQNYPPNIDNTLTMFAGSDFIPAFLYEKQIFVDASMYRQLAESAGLVVTSMKNTDTVWQSEGAEH